MKIDHKKSDRLPSVDDVTKPINDTGVTDKMIDDIIVKAGCIRFPDTVTTVCCLTLRNGYVVTGFHTCANAEDYSETMGQRKAILNAREKVRELEGYLLQVKLFKEQHMEDIAEKVHQAYLDTCEKLGWEVKPSNQVPYSELSEDSKELDRASVRAVLS